MRSGCSKHLRALLRALVFLLHDFCVCLPAGSISGSCTDDRNCRFGLHADGTTNDLIADGGDAGVSRNAVIVSQAQLKMWGHPTKPAIDFRTKWRPGATPPSEASWTYPLMQEVENAAGGVRPPGARRGAGLDASRRSEPRRARRSTRRAAAAAATRLGAASPRRGVADNRAPSRTRPP